MPMVLRMMANGNIIFSTVPVKKLGVIIQNLKVIIIKVKNKARVNIFGKMAQHTTVNGLIIKYMVMVSTFGLSAESMKETGN